EDRRVRHGVGRSSGDDNGHTNHGEWVSRPTRAFARLVTVGVAVAVLGAVRGHYVTVAVCIAGLALIGVQWMKNRHEPPGARGGPTGPTFTLSSVAPAQGNAQTEAIAFADRVKAAPCSA